MLAFFVLDIIFLTIPLTKSGLALYGEVIVVCIRMRVLKPKREGLKCQN